jgi:hypothetical protein
VAVLGAILSNDGVSEPLVLVSAVDTPQAGWVILPVDAKPLQVLSLEEARERIRSYSDGNGIYWAMTAPASNSEPGA